ncbi:glyoxalase [Gordoniibacillus kamchatkensis]|uniref:Glyoxalase n=1 Tax=Gordoniibacillus kamchatkensis TaxID=1590651 RepID=A0ABR5AKF8_9BACL|nr:VOC family protein [Paenibacillus sp. VKM B-2647]KIL41516.1 glyoxalase [Paenibacillus sp. VKM B-2647]
MSYQFIGIDHVQLAAPAGSEAEARRFYGELLGLTEVDKPSALRARGGVWFQAGQHQLHIGIQDDHEGAPKAHPAFHVENVLLLKLHLKDHGVQVIDDNSLPDATRFYAVDPFGNRLEFLERRELI